MIRRFAARVARVIRSNDGAVAIETPLGSSALTGTADDGLVLRKRRRTSASEDAGVGGAGIAIANSSGTSTTRKIGTLGRDRLISRVEWGVIVGVLLLDLCLARTTGVGLSHPGQQVKLLAVLLALWPAIAVVTRLTGFAVGAEVIAENVAKFFWFTLVASVFTYFLTTSSRPLQDAMVVEIDKALGFSWQYLFQYVSSRRWLVILLTLFYMTLLPQALLVITFVGAIYPRRPNRFITAFIISALVTCIIFFLVPVAGPFVTFHHPDMPGAHYVDQYLRMRNHTLPAIPIDDLQGIISFPSFHVSSAVVLTYFFRCLPVIFPLAVVTNVGMSVAALYVGGHYLSDALAGAMVGVVTIAIVRWLDGSEPKLPWRRPAAPEKTGELSLESSAPVAAK